MKNESSDEAQTATEHISVNVGENLTELRYLELISPTMDFEYSYAEHMTAYGAGAGYTLSCYQLSDGERRYYLTKRISDTEVSEGTEIVLGSTLDDFKAIGLDVISERDIAVLFAGADNGFRLLHIDENGSILTETDVTKGYLERGMEADALSEGAGLGQRKFWCDGQGRQYLLTEAGYKLTAFDRDGNYLNAWDYTQEERYYFAAGTHRTDGGLLIDRINAEEGKQEWMEISGEKKELSPFLTISGIDNCQLTFLTENLYLYSGESRLWLVDGRLEDKREVYNYLQAGFQGEVVYLTLTDNGEIVLYLEHGGRAELLVLGEETETAEQGFRIVNLYGDDYEMKSLINGYKKESGQTVAYEMAELQEQDEMWTRIMAELVSGKGPDVICMDASDERFDILYEKGILESLDGMAPEDTLKQVFPELLKAGTRGNELYGLVIYGDADAYMVSNDVWKEEHWTTEEVLKLIEETESLENIGLSIYGSGCKASPNGNLEFLALHHMENSPFLDMEAGKSKFDEELFTRALTYAKKYSGEVSMDEMEGQVKSGQALAGGVWVWKPYHFAEAMKIYGEECHFIGYPGQTDGVGYWRNCCMILVNKNSKHQEQVKELLGYLLSTKGQRKVNEEHTSVCENLIRDCELLEYDGKWYFRVGMDSTGGAWYFDRGDGTSYMEEYIAFLKKLEVETPQPKVLQQLIAEEAESFFRDEKSVEQVTEIIHNRVQLYLDEQ